jgi:hypothetical protein
MSVVTMARLAEGDSVQPDSTLQSSLRLIAAYVPSEAIAAYIILLGLLNPPADSASGDVTIVRLVVFVIGVLVAFALSFITFQGGGLTRREQRRRQLVVGVMATVSFATFAAAMPSFFFDTTIVSIGFSRWAAIAVVIVSVVMPTVARALNVRK